ncbi:YmfQ family protein [Abyssisolibacter fermentans]|uniref:YmfQ family protein n=1 Tax=Abyssisolibacter fermentans TaxID=1766203 RepID=UPI000AA3A85B|nr:YmfQ family protein [Abyssisolibacter fermentans]
MANRLMSYLPNSYKTSHVMVSIADTENNELQDFKANLEGVLNQFFIETADFTLERWEKDLGIPVNNSKDLEYRRSVIKSKLRGKGTITINLIKNVAESYSNGEVEVTEDNKNYNFIIKFVGIKGIPPNMDDLKKAIEEIKPAHLGFDFEYTYNTWDMVSDLTWESAFVNTWEEYKTI